MDLFYTYIWRDAKGDPFYVGKGKGNRAWVTWNRSPEFRTEYEKGGCTVEVVDEFILNSQANESEAALIETYGRREFGGVLVNKTDGGDGTVGAICTEEKREKIRSALTGVKHTKERRENISTALLGREFSVEHRAAISKGLTGVPKSPEHRANATAAIRTPYVRERQSAATTLRWANPANKEAAISALRAKGPRRDNTSGFKGVSFDGTAKKWHAYLNINGKRQSLGHFEDAQSAATAYDAAVITSGVGGYLNFPPMAANDNTDSTKTNAA